MFYITGDRHANFSADLRRKWNSDDVLIVLGDSGFNYYGDERDVQLKKQVSKKGITLFNIHGNHEMRPTDISTYKTKVWNGGIVYFEDDFPNLLFAKDGEIYTINGLKTLVIGGAYSIDKFQRIARGWRWFSNEQPDETIKRYVKEQLNKNDWNVDVVLTHTCPYKYEPKEWFFKGVMQDTVDKSTERWLDEIENKLFYKKWFCGHFHGEKQVESIEFLYNTIKEFKLNNC